MSNVLLLQIENLYENLMRLLLKLKQGNEFKVVENMVDSFIIFFFYDSCFLTVPRASNMRNLTKTFLSQVIIKKKTRFCKVYQHTFFLLYSVIILNIQFIFDQSRLSDRKVRVFAFESKTSITQRFIVNAYGIANVQKIKFYDH